MTKSPKISTRWVAHRGDCENHVENTLKSIQAAIENDITYIEIDIHLTKEGLPIVFHDRNLKRMFDINKRVAEVNFQEIQSLPLKTQHKDSQSPYYIPTLTQVVSLINQYPHVTLYVEVKNTNFTYFSYQFVYKNILECLKSILKQVIIIGFSYRFLRVVKKESNLPIAYVLPSWKHYSAKMLANLKPDFIFSDIGLIPKNENFHTKKEQWFVYEVSTTTQASTLIRQGIYGFESFTPALLQSQFNALNT